MGVGLLPLRASGSSVHSLKEQKNLNSFFAVMFGLSNSAISRLAHTWEVSAICWVGQGLPTSVLSQAPACPGRPGWEWGPHLRAVTASPASPSQRLPHKVRKLYSALERLLVSAPRPRHPGPTPGFFPTAPLPVLGHFLDFQPWVRAWFPLACGSVGLAEKCSVSTVGVCVLYYMPQQVYRGPCGICCGICWPWGLRCQGTARGVLTCLRTQEAGLDPTPMVFWGLSEAPQETQGA